jgi:hypothetical protein
MAGQDGARPVDRAWLDPRLGREGHQQSLVLAQIGQDAGEESRLGRRCADRVGPDA